MRTQTTHQARLSAWPDWLFAPTLVIIIIVTEYIARHFALFWLPVLGALRVNDMLMTGLAYSLLVWLTIPHEKRSLAAIWRTVREIVSFARDWRVWLAAFLALVATLVSIVDMLLWGGVQLPSLSSPWHWDATLLQPLAPLLVSVSMLLVNGVVIPFAEEWLWRGLIQPRFIGMLGFVPGLLLTAVLFSLKHAIIDASLGRLLTLTVLGLIVGWLAARRGWRASALAHALVNTVATMLTLIINQGMA